jgi:hypothetical protein
MLSSGFADFGGAEAARGLLACVLPTEVLRPLRVWAQRANRENRATHGPQDQAAGGHQRLAEAANIVAGHGNTRG